MATGGVLRSFLLTYCTASFVVFSATVEDTNPRSTPELSVSMTNSLYLVCRAELSLPPKLVLTIQILGSHETKPEVTVDDKRKNLHHDDTSTFVTTFKVFASGDSSGVRTSPYVANMMAPTHVSVTGKVKGTSMPWLQLALLDTRLTYYGQYMCYISYLDNAADNHISVWQSEVISVSTETLFPQQKPRFKVIPQSIQISCMYGLHEGANLQEMTIKVSSSGAIMTMWSSLEGRLDCEDDLICHHTTLNSTQFSLHVHCFSEEPLCKTDARDLICAVRVKANGVIVEKTSGKKRPNQETRKSALAVILVVVCSAVLLSIVVIVVCVIVKRRKRRKSWTLANVREVANCDGFHVGQNVFLPQDVPTSLPFSLCQTFERVSATREQTRTPHIVKATPINSENNSEDEGMNEEIPDAIERVLDIGSRVSTMSRSDDLTLENGCLAE